MFLLFLQLHQSDLLTRTGRPKLNQTCAQTIYCGTARPPRHWKGSSTSCSLRTVASSRRLWRCCEGSVKALCGMPCTQPCSPMQPSPRPQHPPTLSPPNLQLDARCTARTAADSPKHAAQWGGIWGVLRTFCGRLAAPSSPPPPSQAPSVSTAHGAPAHAGVTVTSAARPASCRPVPAQPARVRVAVSGAPVLHRLLLK